MSVALQLVCDVCGRRTPERLFDGALARSVVEEERVVAAAKAWRRTRRGSVVNRDLCGGCLKSLLEQQEAARASR